MEKTIDPIYYNARTKLAEINNRIASGTFSNYNWGRDVYPKPKETIIAKRTIPKEKIKKPNSLPVYSFPIHQPTPITKYNFYIATIGHFTEIKEVGKTYTSFFKSKGSEYFISRDQKYIIRISDHWGAHIKNCSWFLSGYPKATCRTWKAKYGQRIGRIKISELRARIVKPKILKT